MIIAGTGHRPARLGISYSRADLKKLTDFALRYLWTRNDLSDLSIISGVALGWDQALALTAIELQIPFTAAIPFDSQHTRWPRPAQDLYNEILSQASRVVCLGTRANVLASFYTRDCWMVDNCDEVLALFDGGNHGGTYNTLIYAEKKKRVVTNLWTGWINCRRNTKRVK